MPAGEGRTVLPCPEVGVGDAEVRALILLPREGVAKGGGSPGGPERQGMDMSHSHLAVAFLTIYENNMIYWDEVN